MAVFSDLIKQRKAEQPEVVQATEAPVGEFSSLVSQRKSELGIGADPFLSGGEKERFESNQPETLGQAFTGELRETEQTKAFPEFSATEDIEIGLDNPIEIGKKLKMTVGLMSSFTPEGQINVIRDSIPEAKFEQDEKGNTIIDINGRKSILNQPGMSAQDVAQAISGVVAFLPAAKMASLVKNVFGKALVGGAASAATEQGIQEASRLAGSEEERSPLKTAFAGALGAGAELVGPARQALKDRSAAKKLGGEVADLAPAAESISAAEKAAEATGIPLFPAQKTAIPAQVEKQSFIAQLPAGARQAGAALKNQNKKASDAVEKFLGDIAPPESVVTGAEKFRTAAQKAKAIAERASSETASPIYKQAFRRQREGNLPLINTGKLKTKIRKMAEQFDPDDQISQSLTKAFKKISAAEGDLQKLHRAKIELDQKIGTFTGEDAVGKTTKRFLTDVKKDLVEVLIDQSPSYRAARSEFIRLLPEIDPLIEKVAGLKDIDLKRVSKIVFDPAETNPQVVLNAKKVIQEVDPEAWNQLVRVELEKRLGTLGEDLTEGALGSIENAPNALKKAIFGGPGGKQKAILMKALDGEALENFKYLETALKRAGLGRPGGSQTAIRGEISKEFDKGIVQSLRDWIVSPIKKGTGIGEEAARNKRIRAAAEMFFDPKYKTEVAKIKKMNPNLATTGKAATQLLKVIESQLDEQ